MRLIDADALDMYECLRSYYGDAWRDAQKAIDNAPTVDPVKPGHWEVVDGTEPRRYGCSVCKRLSWTEDNYCSYCGAKMDEVTNETN